MSDEARPVKEETRRVVASGSRGVAPGAWLGGLSLAAVSGLGAWSYFRYRASQVMDVAVREYRDREYPEDPARRSVRYGAYSGRRLTLVQRDDSRFDFIFAPTQPHVAEVAFRNVDVNLMTPGLPEWTRDDPALRRIALTDRQWNRQQVQFDRDSPILSTFQALGALSLVLGTFGLGTVLLRNVLERRRELALLRATGYRRGHLVVMVIAESAFLMASGLLLGVACALVAIAPAYAERGQEFPVGGTLALLAAVFASGLLSTVVATRAVASSTLLPALKNE